jgi:hypothetical protein
LPSQKPVVPQLAAPCAMHCPVGSVPVGGIGVQAPRLPASAHDIHFEAQAVAQQAPCAQMLLVHSVAVAQTAPTGLSPQEPALQEAGETQSASAAQVDLHAAVPQRKGAHELDSGVTQLPAPSQLDAGVKVVPLAGQLAPAQEVPCMYF